MDYKTGEMPILAGRNHAGGDPTCRQQKEQHLGDRKTALRNLKKANEARRKGKQQKAPDDWEARSRVRLERIIEKAVLK
jgi:hypothetical protein